MFVDENADTSLTRRSVLLGSLGAVMVALPAVAQQASLAARPAACPRCGGSGRLPLKDQRSSVWVEPATLPKPEVLVAEQFCPVCQTDAKAEVIVQEVKDQVEAALKQHRQWEERTGWKLVCVITRHGTLHSQLSPSHTKAAATAVETLMLHLKRVTDSLALATTRPDTLQFMLLLEKTSWEAFRKVMEEQYSPQQLGESWMTAGDLNAYDHWAVPHLYETPQTMRLRPPSCGITFMAARRQLNRATDWKAPFWLSEGFAAYGDYYVHKLNRWYTTYAGEAVPPGDWMAASRKLAAEATYREWSKLLRFHQLDWEPHDHAQTMSMAAFLFESQPAKFLEYLRLLASGDESRPALEHAYGASVSELEERWVRWLLAKR